MALINVQINTEDKTMDIDIDGKKLKDVCSITCSADGCYGPELYLSISTHTKNEDETLRMVNMISMASNNSGKLVRKSVPADKIKKGALPTNVMVNEID